MRKKEKEDLRAVKTINREHNTVCHRVSAVVDATLEDRPLVRRLSIRQRKEQRMGTDFFVFGLGRTPHVQSFVVVERMWVAVCKVPMSSRSQKGRRETYCRR